ncbi:unnamed protein product [Blepharisma stoltei]|uniref:Uncharacterized protein n=1 Tax=Blepharisma stoltei TaxID=1481888 RepID=A0AAU9JXT3_9CILI|nr:unnamed protein product [Blepharisma stoltei]
MFRASLFTIPISLIALIVSGFSTSSQNTQLSPDLALNSSPDQTSIFLQDTLQASRDTTSESTLSFIQQEDSSTETSEASSDTSSSDTDDTNPLDRDEDNHQLPEDSDDGGDEYSGGDTYYILATSFIDNEESTGKVYVIPMKSEDSSFEILGGLEKPVGICFDINNNFLYVVDAGTGNNDGYIYQYEISWDKEKSFALSRNIYVIVYEGESPYDCKVDKYGNLYFVESSLNQINAISYLDLYTGLKNQQYTLYQADSDSNTDISSPCALDLYESEGIYYVNNEDFDTSGTVNYALINSTTINANDIQQCVTHDVAPWGVTYSEEERVFYSLDSGELCGFDIGNNTDSFVKVSQLSEPRGLCYGDGKIYISDHSDGVIYRVKDNDEEETPTAIVNLQGAYAVFCVNEGDFAIGLVIMWIALISYLLI